MLLVLYGSRLGPLLRPTSVVPIDLPFHRTLSSSLCRHLILDGLDVTGWVSEADRGRVKGSATGYPSTYSDYMTVGFSNSVAQYW